LLLYGSGPFANKKLQGSERSILSLSVKNLFFPLTVHLSHSLAFFCFHGRSLRSGTKQFHTKGQQLEIVKYCGGAVLVFILSYVFYYGASKAQNLCIVRGENPRIVYIKHAPFF
jgi:hypothetical protein